MAGMRSLTAWASVFRRLRVLFVALIVVSIAMRGLDWWVRSESHKSTALPDTRATGYSANELL